MKRADVVVIGGSAAGLPAAIGCRRRYPQKKRHLDSQRGAGVNSLWVAVYSWNSGWS